MLRQDIMKKYGTSYFNLSLPWLDTIYILQGTHRLPLATLLYMLMTAINPKQAWVYGFATMTRDCHEC